MTKGKQVKIYLSGHRIALVAVLCFFALCVQSVVTQKKHKPKGKDEKIYLIHSDELKFDHYGMNPDAQIAKGRVHFRHQGAELWCDSAYFYQESNSVKAFGNVRFRQGDTLSLTSRYADYDGVEQRMAARYNVVLTHRKQVLRTDSLNYDRLYNYAYFLEGGVLEDGKDKLVADWGKYNLETREAVFYYIEETLGRVDSEYPVAVEDQRELHAEADSLAEPYCGSWDREEKFSRHFGEA